MIDKTHQTMAAFCLALPAILATPCQSLADDRDPSPPTTSVFQVLAQSNRSLSQDDPRQLPMKLRSLTRNEYKFFRGTADLFYDYAKTHFADWMNATESVVLLHGDLHIGNVGTFRAPSGANPDIRFGFVDLDESAPGPFQLDLLRALTAIRFAARDNRANISEEGFTAVADPMCAAYAIAVGSDQPDSDLATRFPEIASLIAEAKHGNLTQYIQRYTHPDPLRFRPFRGSTRKPKDIMTPVDDATAADIASALWDYVQRANRTTPDQFRYQSPSDLQNAILSVALWTKTDSSGSQGLTKYLVLLDRPFGNETNQLIMQLKEEPTPAARRIGLLETKTGTDRAGEVANAYARFYAPGKWLVGHTKIADRGFLIKTKDPWGEELSEENFTTQASIVRLGEILGHVAGAAHRNALRADGKLDHAPHIAQQAKSLSPILTTRSRDITNHLAQAYGELSSDPQVVKLVREADLFIKNASRPNSSPPKPRD